MDPGSSATHYSDNGTGRTHPRDGSLYRAGITISPFVKKMSEEATRLIFENLAKVFQDGSLITERGNMFRASYCGDAAFTRASVGYVHAIAHNLGGPYGVPHGLANAVVLPFVLEKVENINEIMGIPKTISGLKGSDIPLIAERALAESNPSYPVPKIMNRKPYEGLIRLLLP